MCVMDAVVHGGILIISSSKYVIEQKKRLIALSIILLVGFHAPSYAHYAQKEKVIRVFHSFEETASAKASAGKKSILPVLPRVEIGPCTFMQKFDKYHADCGTLFVKEDPTESHTAKNNARVVSIPIIIFQPAGEVTGDPVVITGGGGPGSSIYIMDEFDGDPSLYYSGIELSTLQNGLPLILMEMRGSGLSLANLDCPAITELEIELLTTYPYKFDNKQFVKTNLNCANRKRALGVDANFYNADYAINDIDALRELLGFQKWHLLGISHGTRISLRYAQQYPQHTASLILDSIYPFEVDSYVNMPELSARIFTQPFTLCDADPRCRLENGQTSETLFASFMSEIKLNPPTLEVEYDDENWTVGQKTLKISPELVAYTLYNNSYDGEAILAFPQIIKDALNKDYAKLSRLISEIIDLQNYTWFSEGAYSSYACYEEIPFSNTELAIKNAKKYKSPYWDDLPAINLDLQLCKIWDIKPALNNIKSFDHNQLTLPVLILAGDLDTFTPTKWAIDFHAKLPMRNKTQHLRVWPLKAHNIVYGDKCVEAVITSFLNDPEQTIDNDCALQNVSDIKTDAL